MCRRSGQGAERRDALLVRQGRGYGGKRIAAGDTIFIFASENEGGPGLIARGLVASVRALPRTRGVARQTPRVSVAVTRTALAKRRLGRRELKPFSDWQDGRPETELNFKLYRQATNKIVGISAKICRPWSSTGASYSAFISISSTTCSIASRYLRRTPISSANSLTCAMHSDFSW